MSDVSVSIWPNLNNKNSCAKTILQVSKSRKVHIPKVRLLSNQSCVLALSEIEGRASISGRIECIGCNLDQKQTSEAFDDTLFAILVESVASLAIDKLTVDAPLRLFACQKFANIWV